MPDAIFLIISAAILIFSVVIHEVSHGVAALALGDKTAKYMGRLTLNPIPHIDPFGSILLPALMIFSGSPFVIGWAKPVPFNPYNLTKAPKWGPGIVAAAGPISNLLVALFFGIIYRLSNASVMFAIPHQTEVALLTIIITNVALAVFNLFPIPPLDGSKVLFSALSYRYIAVIQFLEAYGFFLIIALLLFAPGLIDTIIGFVLRLIIGYS